VAVLITEKPYEQNEIELIIDIVTNGELIFGNRQRMVSCSCATEPAFEGAEIKHGMRAAPGAIEKIIIDKEKGEVKYKVMVVRNGVPELPIPAPGASTDRLSLISCLSC
jgi:uncharacterized 2Fe-2S/4Fe-4S cluster protein (DUF4445 family)